MNAEKCVSGWEIKDYKKGIIFKLVYTLNIL